MSSTPLDPEDDGDDLEATTLDDLEATHLQAGPDRPAGPYEVAVALYRGAGWAGVLPLPERKKADPPRGYTGRGGSYPSGADIQAWLDAGKGIGNIGLRVEDGYLLLDVDHYPTKRGATKRGGDTLAELEAKYGPLPVAPTVSARGDDINGIRLYRVRPGRRWKFPSDTPNLGIDLIHEGWRYAVVWPSINPATGETYQWRNIPEGQLVPTPEDAPWMPEQWQDAFDDGPDDGTAVSRRNMLPADIAAWLETYGQGTVCGYLTEIVASAADHMRHGATRHDTTTSAVWALIAGAMDGHVGMLDALGRLHDAFVEAINGDRDTRHEWKQMIVGAVSKLSDQHPDAAPPSPWHRCDGTDGIIAPTAPAGDPYGTPSTPVGQSDSVALTPTGTGATSGAADEADVLAAYVAARYRFTSGDAFVLDTPDKVPAIWGRGDDVLWAEGEALTLAGPPGVGKTTLAAQVVKARIIGGDVLGLPVQPTGSRILYLAMDRPRQIARLTRLIIGTVPRHVLNERLRFMEGPPLDDLAQHPDVLLALARHVGADTIIVDSIKDAAIGLSNDEVGAGYNRARQKCLANGVEIVELHHLIKRGEGGRKPTTLADLYGSVWISAGAGSVILLYGEAGDPIVKFTHLKQPANEVGPFEVVHDRDHGVTSIFEQADLVVLAKSKGAVGLTAQEAARAVRDKDETSPISRSDKLKVQRRLDQLVEGGRLRKVEGAAGGDAARWFWVSDDPSTAGIIAPGQGVHGGCTQPLPDGTCTEGARGGRDRLSGAQTGGAREGARGAQPLGCTHPSPPIKGGDVPLHPFEEVGQDTARRGVSREATTSVETERAPS